MIAPTNPASSKSLRMANDGRIRILLAEDTPATRDFLVSAFDSEIYSVDTARDGEEAVQRFHHSTYDIVLTDLQMPRLDGLSAARKMRWLESIDPLRERTPIVAITAGAVETTPEKCSDAGMDAYFSKPIDLPNLFSTVHELTNTPRKQSEINMVTPNANQPEPSRPKTLNVEAALDRMQGNHELYKSMVGFFMEDYPSLMGRLRRGVEQRDAEEIRQSAHAIKGLAAGIGAERVVDSTAKIEECARADRIEYAIAELADLEKNITIAIKALAPYVG